MVLRERKKINFPTFPIRRGMILVRDEQPFICNGRFNIEKKTVGAYVGINIFGGITKACTKDRWTYVDGCKKASIEETKQIKKLLIKFECNNEFKKLVL